MKNTKQIKKTPVKVKLYNVEKGVKMPEVAINSGASEPSRVVLTMQSMAVGESFLIKDALEALKGAKIVVDFNGRQRKHGGGKQFATRKMKNGTRVWRVK